MKRANIKESVRPHRVWTEEQKAKARATRERNRLAAQIIELAVLAARLPPTPLPMKELEKRLEAATLRCQRERPQKKGAQK
jgi:hypothetical protein